MCNGVSRISDPDMLYSAQPITSWFVTSPASRLFSVFFLVTFEKKIKPNSISPRNKQFADLGRVAYFKTVVYFVMFLKKM